MHLSQQWRIGVAGVAMIGVTFGLARYGYGLFLPEIRREFGLSVSQVGLIGSATYAGYLTAVMLVGALATRLGPRCLIAVAGFSAAAGMTLAAVSTRVDLLVAGLVLAGTSSGWAWAPYSDAVDRVVPPRFRERVMALIPTGTAVGAAVAGPAALLWQGSTWRIAWLVFAVLALAATLANLKALPRGKVPLRREPRRLGWVFRRDALPLYLSALSYGLGGAVYWTFAIEGIGGGQATASLFWTLMGVAGIAGVLTGVAIARLGVRRAHALIFVTIALAVALLGAAPGLLPAVVASAVLFGPAFMAGSGLLVVWSYQVFPERPTTGFSATVFALGIGTVLGPALLGVVTAFAGLRATFLLTAVVVALALLFRPERRAPPATFSLVTHPGAIARLIPRAEPPPMRDMCDHCGDTLRRRRAGSCGSRQG